MPATRTAPRLLLSLLVTFTAAAHAQERYTNVDGSITDDTKWWDGSAAVGGASQHLIFGGDAAGDPVTFGTGAGELAPFTMTHDGAAAAFVINKITLLGAAGDTPGVNVLSNGGTGSQVFRLRGAGAGIYNESAVDYRFDINIQGGNFDDYGDVITLGGNGTGIVSLNGNTALTAQASKAYDVQKVGTSRFDIDSASAGAVRDFFILEGTLGVGNPNAFGQTDDTTVYLGDGGSGGGDATLRIKNVSVNSSIKLVVRAGSTGTQAINLNGNNGAWNGDIELGKSLTIINETGGNSSLNGIISSIGDVTLTKAGDNVLQLTGDNTYGGTTVIAAGNLRAGHNNAFGSSTVELSGDGVNGTTVHLSSGVTVGNNLSVVVAGGNRTLRFDGGATWAGDISLDRGLRFQGTTEASDVATISGNISGTGGITKLAQASSVVLTGNNTYSGATTIQAGGFYVNGTHVGGNYTVQADGLLGGTGGISSAVNIMEGGYLSPGSLEADIETLEMLTARNLTIDGTFVIDIDGAAHDQFLNANNVFLGVASVLLLDTANLTLPSYTILTFSGSVTGTFFDTSSVEALGYHVVYDNAAGQIRIEGVAIPTPMALPAALALMGGMLLRRPRR